MALTSYWWLLGWMFLTGIFSLIVNVQREEVVLGKKEMRWRWLPALLVVIPLIIWAGFRKDGFGDTRQYRETFKAMSDSLSSLKNIIEGDGKDKGYYAAIVLFKHFIADSDVLFFLVIAIIQLLLLTVTYRAFSKDFWFSIFLFVASCDYLSWMHNGMRQFIVVSVLFAAFPLLVQKRYFLMIAIVLLLYPFHASVLIFLPFIFLVQGKAWNWKTFVFILVVVF